MAGVIGLFDSGVGGLSVWREVADALPDQALIYFADQAYCPYGSRSLTEIRDRAERVARFLLQQGADLLVVACNTASAAALGHLREIFPVPIVGMEPALKPAVEQTHSGRVAVMATPATFQGESFARLMARFAHGVDVILQPCPGLVEQVEQGDLYGRRTLDLLQHYLADLADRGVDELVLGCTHYPFLRPAIEHIVGPTIQVIDPAPAVARQVQRVWQQMAPSTTPAATTPWRFVTSGDPAVLQRQLRDLLGFQADVELKALGMETT
jgi:glutamate racemase